MRIAKLELLAYGPFQRTTLDFSKPALHVVFGRNEAGKSTTLRAITGLLYGIDPKTPDAHVHKFGELRIGGVLEDAKGERVRFVRRKGNANTLLGEDDKPLDETVVKKLLGGVTKETFESAFGLDHDTLEAGAQALLDGKGDLGETLFDASVGGGGEVQRLLIELAAEADKIYKPRASALPLNEALKAFAEAQKRVRERQSLPDAFLTQERALEAALEERAASVTTREKLAARRARLERARRRVPIERRRDRASARLEVLGVIVKQTARAFALKDRFAAYERALTQQRTHLAEADRLAERVAEAARRAGLSEVRPELRLDARREARVHSLLRERTTLKERLEAASGEIARQEREVARIAVPEAVPLSDALRSALERARALGDVEARIAAEQLRIDRKRADLELKAKALYEGTLDALVLLRVPATSAIEKLEARASEAARTVRRLEERADDLRKEEAAIAKQLALQSGDFAPPDAAALTGAREARDRALAAAFETPARRLEAERLLHAADAVADRMIREADRVTTVARLRSEAKQNAAMLAKVASERALALEEQARIDAERAALVEGAPPSEDLRHWLERRARVVEIHDGLREATHALADEVAKADAATRELARALEAEGTLRELIARATRKLDAHESALRAAEEGRRLLAKLHVEIDERRAVTERDRAALEDVSERLAELLEPLGVPADASAEEVNRALEALRDLFAAIERRADAETRARAAEAETTAFEADLSRALADLAPDLMTMAPPDAAQLFFERAHEAKANSDDLATATAELEAAGEVTLDDDERLLAAHPEAAAKAEQELAEKIDELDVTITRLGEHIGGLRSGLQRMSVDSNASEAAESAQQALARIRENAERWSRLRLAWVLLSREIERYREEHQAPLLATSSTLFSRLTLGAFSGVKAGFDERDRPCLRCLRGAHEEVDVTGLSDGTRDQLYLSLRLASLLRRADAAEPMPLILDDVLIQLDDERAAAALRVLAEVAQRMQVLLFTHHARIVDLARGAVSELVVHELGALAASGRDAVAL